MRISLLKYAKEGLAIQNALQHGYFLKCLSLVADRLEEQDAEQTVAIMTMFTYSFYTCRYEHIVSGLGDQLLAKEWCEMPFAAFMHLVDDSVLRKYLEHLVEAIEAFCNQDELAALEKLEYLCERSEPYEAPHYFLASLAIQRNDHEQFSKSYNELNHKTKEFALKDSYDYTSGGYELSLEAEDLFLPLLPRNLVNVFISWGRGQRLIAASEKKFSELSEHISREGSETRKEVQEQAAKVISAMSTILNDVSNVIRIERAEYLKQVQDEQQTVEELAGFILEKVKTIEGHIQEQDVTKASDALAQWFGSELWNNDQLLSDVSRNLLITGEVIFDNLNKPSKRNLDFSPAVIPLTKAYENELFRHFYEALHSFCMSRFGGYNQHWPELMIHPNPYVQKSANVRYVKNTIHFTLGSVNKMINDMNFKRIANAFTADYFQSGFDLAALSRDVAHIKNHYRDKVAHKEGISFTDAKSCRDEMIEVNKRFIRFLSMIRR